MRKKGEPNGTAYSIWIMYLILGLPICILLGIATWYETLSLMKTVSVSIISFSGCCLLIRLFFYIVNIEVKWGKYKMGQI